MSLSRFKNGLCCKVLSLAAIAFALPVLSMAEGPSIAGLPEAVTGTQALVPFSGPTGPTYSSFLVATPVSSGVIYADSPSNPYNVWCVNPYGYIQGIPESYTLYNSYDPTLWSFGNEGSQAQWEEINWLLNNKTGHSQEVTPTVLDLQMVIYNILVPGYNSTDLSPAASQLLSDATIYGKGFVPAPGQILGLVLYNAGINPSDGPNSVQDLLLEYVLPSVPQVPGLKITKSANVTTAKCTDQVTYTYVVTNTGNMTLTGISIVDDNGTPSYSGDDVTIASNVTLSAGQSKTYTRALSLPVTYQDNGGNNHLLITQLLPNGNVQVTFLEDLNVVDNSYGNGSSPDWGGGNNPLNHLGQDSAEFQFVDGAGNTVLDFAADYVSLSGQYPSGVGTAGISGGAGHLYSGNPANIVSIDTTITDNMNQPGNVGSWYTNSPPPGYKNWNFRCGYTVVVKGSCFGKNGFGGCNIKNVQHTHCKTSNPYQCSPTPICTNVTNTVTATATADVNGQNETLTATARATVAETTGSQCSNPAPPPCKCPCWNCQHGDHQHCQNTGCHDTGCQQRGCQQSPCSPKQQCWQQQQCQPPSPKGCNQIQWVHQCNQSFRQCGGRW